MVHDAAIWARYFGSWPSSENAQASFGEAFKISSMADFAPYAKLLSLNIDAADIGHRNAAGMMGKKKNGISVDSKLLELTKEYLS